MADQTTHDKIFACCCVDFFRDELRKISESLPVSITTMQRKYQVSYRVFRSAVANDVDAPPTTDAVFRVSQILMEEHLYNFSDPPLFLRAINQLYGKNGINAVISSVFGKTSEHKPSSKISPMSRDVGAFTPTLPQLQIAKYVDELPLITSSDLHNALAGCHSNSNQTLSPRRAMCLYLLLVNAVSISPRNLMAKPPLFDIALLDLHNGP